MIKIVLPANMETAIDHLAKAGWVPQFIDGQDFGWIKDKVGENRVIRLRSFDIPIEVDGSCDAGLCGSDVFAERSLSFPLKLEVLARFSYGRKFGTTPTLALVAPKEEKTKSVGEVKPGTIILTEHPNLTRRFLESHGLAVSLLGEVNNSSQEKLLPQEFRSWCVEEGRVGMRIVHGRIPALVRLGAGLGVMVNETGQTLAAYDLKVVGKIMDIEVILMADREALADPEKGHQIRQLKVDLERAYFQISSEYESSLGTSHEREP